MNELPAEIVRVLALAVHKNWVADRQWRWVISEDFSYSFSMYGVKMPNYRKLRLFSGDKLVVVVGVEYYDLNPQLPLYVSVRVDNNYGSGRGLFHANFENSRTLNSAEMRDIITNYSAKIARTTGDMWISDVVIPEIIARMIAEKVIT